MNLVIAEKPSLGKAIASNMPGKWSQGKGYLKNDQGDVVTWCIGHVYELAPPGYYNGGVKGFSFKTLPLLPTEWKKLPTASTKDQVKVIKDLLKTAKTVVHAGDPDREGQVIVDELLDDVKFKGNVERLWLNATDPTSVKRALSSMKPNTDYYNLSEAGVARAKCDWLVGMNLTPAFTLAAQKTGFTGTLSIGRVQTPTLAMVVTRCMEIENFKPQDYFSISANLKVQAGTFTGRYKVDDTQIGVDAEGRVKDKALADAIVARVQNSKGVITKCDTKRTNEGPPMGYSLGSLQIAASAKYGYSAQQVLDLCQGLYDPAKGLLSYPRTDCEFLPESQHGDAKIIMANLAGAFPVVAKGNAGQKGKIFNDKKVTAHHAIVPTLKQANLALLSPAERNIYEMVALRYAAQFFPDYVYDKTSVETTFDNGKNKDVFQASGRIEISQGWREVLPAQGKKNDEESQLPRITQGEAALPLSVKAEAKKTEPPAYFNQGTLLAAMTDVHKFVTDPNIKKRLKEVAGIGTPATRASIIETIYKREFVMDDGKKIKDTPTGRALILALPAILKDPGMTALWEDALESITDGKMTANQFLEMQSKSLVKLVDMAKDMKIEVPQTRSAAKAAASSSSAVVGSCPKCGKSMIKRVAKSGGNAGNAFFGCSGYPECKHTEFDNSKKQAAKGGSKTGAGKTSSGSKSAANKPSYRKAA